MKPNTTCPVRTVSSTPPLLTTCKDVCTSGIRRCNSPSHPGSRCSAIVKASRDAYATAVVLLGVRLLLGDLVAVGLPGVLIIAVTVVATLTLTCLIGDKLGLDRGLVTLIAAGFSICGAAAIAAVESAVKRRDEDVGLAIAMVTLFGSAMIMIMPLGQFVFGLSDLQLGVWAGASVHEVAQVVAAASFGEAAAVAAATTIRLGRALCLAGVFSAARWRGRTDVVVARGRKLPIVPWFVVGFLLAAGLRTTGLRTTGLRTAGWLSASVLDVTNVVTNVLLASAMFGLGMGIRFAVLFPVPWRVVGLAAALGGRGGLCLAPVDPHPVLTRIRE